MCIGCFFFNVLSLGIILEMILLGQKIILIIYFGHQQQVNSFP